MSTIDDTLKPPTEQSRQKNFSESQKQSAYFNMDDGYDPLVYENTWPNIAKIIAMLIVFYIFQFLHWNANFALGTADTNACTIYNLIIFGSAIIVIIIMLILGAQVNKKKLTHEFYMEKISEEKQRMAEDQAKEAQKRANKAALEEYDAGISKQ